MRLGVADSGRGALSVIRELLALSKNTNLSLEILCFSDYKNLPYGTKTATELRKIAYENSKFLKLKNLDAFLIACNTMCAYGKSEFMSDFENVFSVLDSNVKALKNALALDLSSENLGNLDGSGVIIFGTKSLISSNIYQNIFPNALCFSVNELTELVESLKVSDLAHFAELNENVLRILEGFRAKINFRPKHILLACTHFPFFKREFEKVFESKVLLQSKLIFDQLIELNANVVQKNKDLKTLEDLETHLVVNNHKITFLSPRSSDLGQLIAFARSYLEA